MTDEDYFHDEDESYCYPDTGVLINKRGIRDKDRYDRMESRITGLRMAELDSDPVCGSFDMDHLKAIHRIIFGDIFEWAGEIRTVEISKGIPFCYCDNIECSARSLFEELSKENHLKGLDEDSIIPRLAYYLGEINAIHPFREGNGRVQRKFIEQLARQAGHPFTFNDVGKKEMIVASALSMSGDNSKMEMIIRRCMEAHEDDSQI